MGDFNIRHNRYFKSCQSCEKRYPGCSAICENYIRERAEYDRVMNNRRKEDLIHQSEVSSALNRKEHFRRNGSMN